MRRGDFTGECISTIQVHRLIMNVSDSKVIVDHKDANEKNNRKSNLRLTDNLGNSRNVSKWTKKTTSKYKGVSLTSDGVWMMSIRTGDEVIGRLRERYDNEDIAGYVYNLNAVKYFGEFANLNTTPSFTEKEIKNSRLCQKVNERSSIHKGISWVNNSQKWLVQFRHNKERIRVGLFSTEEDAYRALINKKKELGILK